MISPAKHPDLRVGTSFTHPVGSEAGTPSRGAKAMNPAAKSHTAIPIAPKWTLSRPYLSLSHLFEPRGAFDGDEPQPKPIGQFPVDVQEILVSVARTLVSIVCRSLRSEHVAHA